MAWISEQRTMRDMKSPLYRAMGFSMSFPPGRCKHGRAGLSRSCTGRVRIGFREPAASVSLEHCGVYFRAARPLTAPPATVGLIIRKVVGIGLDNLAVFQEQQSHFFGRHMGDEGFGFVEGGAQPYGDVRGIDRLAAQ